MIKYFTNRELSRRLGINLAKWKRWSREFLPPDPLGGMQSGYARQYNPDEAFKVNLGGYVVADLKFTIPEAKQILQDLHGWLADKGFYFNAKGNATPKKDSDGLVQRYIIFMGREKRLDQNKFNFFYIVRGIISNEPVHYKGFEIMKELYVETSIGLKPEMPSTLDMITDKMLNITDVLNNFIKSLDLDRAHYPALNPK